MSHDETCALFASITASGHLTGPAQALLDDALDEFTEHGTNLPALLCAPPIPAVRGLALLAKRLQQALNDSCEETERDRLNRTLDYVRVIQG